MADIIKNSFAEDSNHVKVLFQRGKDVCDFELNEFQDILRVLALRAIYTSAQQTIALAADLNPGSSDDGFKVTAAGLGVVNLGVGLLLADGHTVRQTDVAASYTPTAWGGGGAETQIIWLRIRETEIADPAQLPQLGETSRRVVIQWTVGTSVNAPIPASSPDELWMGGDRYFALAEINRTAVVIAPGDITDLRHLLPASLMAMITRQANFEVQAVVASILETPDGVLLPKSKTLTVDVDPDGTLGPDGVFRVRFNRDATPRVTFRVNSKTGDRTLWESDEIIEFRDPSVAGAEASSGQESIPLTGTVADNGDQCLRLGERGILGTSVDPTSLSLLRLVNGRWCVTVGDGVSTFGDFNGLLAVNDAVSWWKTYLFPDGHTSCLIQVKAGTYQVDPITLPATENSVTLEGASSYDCILENVSSTDPMITSSVTRLILKGLGFTSLTPGTTHPCGIVSGGTMEVENCTFVDQAVKVLTRRLDADTSRSFVARFKTSQFSFTAAVTTQPAVVLEANHASYYSVGYLFDECYFDMSASEAAPLEVLDTVTTVTAKIGGVVFNRCLLHLGSTVVQTSNPRRNTGVLALSPHTGNKGKLNLTDITYNDCTVIAEKGSNTTALLVYLPQDPANDYVDLGSFVVRGGSWLLQSATALSTFVLGVEPAMDVPPRVARVLLEDVVLGPDVTSSIDYGAPPATAGYSAGSRGGLFLITAAHITMRTVAFKTCVARGRQGQLVCVAGSWSVDGVHLTNWVNTSSYGVPACQVRFKDPIWDPTPRGGSIRGVVVEGSISGVPVTDTVSAGVFGLESSWRLPLDSCRVHGFDGTGAHGFVLSDLVHTHGVELHECEASDLGGMGFRYYDDGITGTAVNKLRITRSRFNGNNVGVFIGGAATGTPKNLGTVSVSDNEMKDNTFVGLSYTPGAWLSSDPGPVITGNVVIDNSGAANAAQAVIGRDEAWPESGVVMGNNFGTTGVLAALPTIGPFSGAALRGIASEYAVSVGAIAYNNSTTTIGGTMLFNVGVLGDF